MVARGGRCRGRGRGAEAAAEGHALSNTTELQLSDVEPRNAPYLLDLQWALDHIFSHPLFRLSFGGAHLAARKPCHALVHE